MVSEFKTEYLTAIPSFSGKLENLEILCGT